MACGSILIEASVPSQRATALTAPPPLVASTVRAWSWAWTSSICRWMRVACFISLPMLDISVDGFGKGDGRFGSGAHVDDLPFENLERLLDQRVVLEVVLLEGDRLGVGLGRRRLVTGRRGRRGRGRGRGGGQVRDGAWRCLGARLRNAHPVRWRFRLDEFDLSIGKAEFGQLGLDERPVLGMV